MPADPSKKKKGLSPSKPPEWDEKSDALRTVLNKPPREAGFDWPETPNHAPPFRPDPLVVGQPRVANLVNEIFKYAPEMKGRNKKITIGPTESSIRTLNNVGLSADQYERTNLLGNMSPTNRNISINPNLYNDDDEMVKTMIHELAHTVGYGEDDSYNIEKFAPEGLLKKYRRMK